MWVAGHAGFEGNEIADNCVKEAARQAVLCNHDGHKRSFAEMKAEFRQDALKSWQRAWDTSDKGRSLHELKPNVKLNWNLPAERWGIVTKRIRLKTGHSRLSDRT